MLGSAVSIVTSRNPVTEIKCCAYSSSCSHIAGETTAPPQFGASTAAFPRSESANAPSPASQSTTRCRLSGSRGSWPLQTSNQRAVSRTLRAIIPLLTVRLPSSTCGARGMRPNVALRPTRPVNPAGIRIEPPPSPPVAIVTRPPATAAALPPDDPPGVRPCIHGLCVAPLSTVRVTFVPPNSLAVHRPMALAPPIIVARSTISEVCVALRSANTTQASVSGQPLTESSSFTPSGTPPNGFDMSADLARARAPSASRNENALSVLAAIAANDASSSSTGEICLARNARTNEQASPSHVETSVATYSK